MRRFIDCKNRKNKGFSLVEVIVAVAILAVAASPMIANFVKSGTVNQKARRQLNEMNLAQDIMEGLSAYKGEDVITKFESAVPLNGTVLPSGSLKYGSHGAADSSGVDSSGLPVNTTLYKCTVASDGSTSESGDRLYNDVVGSSLKPKFDPANPDYYFYISDIEYKSGTQTKHYDAQIKMTYSGYEDSIGVELNRMYDVNNKIDVSYSNVVRTTDNKTNYEDAISWFSTELNSPVVGALNETLLAGNLEQLIRCEVKNDSIGGANNYQVIITDRYKIKDSMIAAWGLNPVDCSYFPMNSESIYDNNTEKPRNIFINYCGTPGSFGTALDDIELVNSTGEKINFYVFRQKRSNGDTLNANYNCEVHIDSPVDSEGNPTCALVHNLRYNLNEDILHNLRYYDEDNNEISATNTKLLNRKKGMKDSDPDINTKNTSYQKSRCNIYYNGISPISSDDYEDIVHDGMMSSTTPPVYDVTIVVTERESGTQVTYTGALSGGKL